MSHEHVLLTGAAGFIGSTLCEALLADGRKVTGIDSFAANYPEAAKRDNIRGLLKSKRFTLVECDAGGVEFRDALNACHPDMIVHLAATPGVRPSIEHVLEYVDNNVRATANVLAGAAAAGVSRIVFGSSSSVYGGGSGKPVREDDPLIPLSPYAATKVSGEALCRSFVASCGLSITCLRFFTVYGPRQRPDMAICKLAHLIESRQPFRMNGDGESSRDYTYISDIVSGIRAALDRNVPFEAINLGSGNPIRLKTMIELTSNAIGGTPIIERTDFPSSEPTQTFADISKAKTELGYEPRVSFEDGIAEFAAWFKATRQCESA
jgi:UDP-glucuronate 4-epimerase